MINKSQIAADPILQYFKYSHLPPHLQKVSETFAGVADMIVNTLPRNPERTVALRKLLEAKDAAVRSAITDEGYKPVKEAPADISVDGPPPFR